MGLLVANVTPEDRQSLLDAMAMIREARATRPSESKFPPNAGWLHRLIKDTLEVHVSQMTIQRHLNGMCRCADDLR